MDREFAIGDGSHLPSTRLYLLDMKDAAVRDKMRNQPTDVDIRLYMFMLLNG